MFLVFVVLFAVAAKIFMGEFFQRIRDCGILEWNPVPLPIPSRTRIPSRYRFLQDTGWGLVFSNLSFQNFTGFKVHLCSCTKCTSIFKNNIANLCVFNRIEARFFSIIKVLFWKMPESWVFSLSLSFLLEFWVFFALSFFSNVQRRSLR